MKRSNISNVDADAKRIDHTFNKYKFHPKAFSNDCKRIFFHFLKQMHNTQFLNNANAKCMQPLIIFNMIK